MSFRDFQYSFGKFKTNVEGQIVRHIPYKNQDTKQLSVWIFRERIDLSSLRTLAYQHSETNKALLDWINGEEDNNNFDLKDLVGDKIIKLLDKQVEIEQNYADKIQLYRQAIKSIRIREERVSDMREQTKALQSRLLQLESSKKVKRKKMIEKIADTQNLLESMEHDTALAERELARFKRIALREAFYLRFNALAEYTEKGAMIAGFGKYLSDLLDQAENDKSYNERLANTIFSDAMQALDHWKPTQSDERPTLTGNLPKNKEEKKKKDKGKSKKKQKKKKQNESEEEQQIEEEDVEELEVEEPLTPPELPPRFPPIQAVSEKPSSSTHNYYYHYHDRVHSSSSTDDSKEESFNAYRETPPPSYSASQTPPLRDTRPNQRPLGDTKITSSQTSLSETRPSYSSSRTSSSNTIPTSPSNTRPSHTRVTDDDEDEEPTDHHDSLGLLTYYPVEQIHHPPVHKRSYMEFSQQYTHRQTCLTNRPFIVSPPLPPPRSHSVTTLPLSLSAPSAPTVDEIHFLPIPSAPPPSEFQ